MLINMMKILTYITTEMKWVAFYEDFKPYATVSSQK